MKEALNKDMEKLQEGKNQTEILEIVPLVKQKTQWKGAPAN
jgi:hypothetical protein